MSTSILKALPGKLDIKRHSPSILYTYFCMFRFYFVGDEDLLEIIGNSKNVGRLQKHFKKMFAGVATITLNDDNSQVLGLLSKEGEEVSDHR